MRHVVRILLFALVSVLIPLTMLKYVDWIAAAIAAVANWIVFTVTWNAARIVDIELVRVNPDPKLVRLYLVYAILSIAALCSAALYGVEPTWAVYGVGAALGTFGVLLLLFSFELCLQEHCLFLVFSTQNRCLAIFF